MKSIRSKILTAMIWITLLASAAVTVIFYRQSAGVIEENYLKTLQQRNAQMIDVMDQTMKNIHDITIYASCDQELKNGIQQYENRQNSEYLDLLAERLKEFCGREAGISSMYLLMKNEKVLVTSEEYPVYKKELQNSDIRNIETFFEEEKSPGILQDLVSYKELQLSFVEEIRSEKEEVLGYILSNVGERELYYQYIDEIYEDTMQEVVLLDDEGRVLTSSEKYETGAVYWNLERYQKRIGGAENFGTDGSNLYSYCKAPFSGFGLFVVTERNAVLHTLQETGKYFVCVLLIVMAAAVFAALYLSGLIYRPLKKLTGAMSKVSEGNLDFRAEVGSNDEIGLLAEDFNEMLDRIEDLIQRLIIEEDRKKDVELEALQYQITPHFMYNTLNSIKYAALIKGETETGKLIGDFVELLQAAISKKGTFITVAEEIHILEKYIHLQEFRYGGQFHVRYEISMETEGYQVPRLLLQPLVENSLLHGMDLKEKEGCLKIKTELVEGRLYLKVTDNGRGMTEEQIRKLLSEKSRKTTGFTAIGIPNIQERLHLYYGEDAGIYYESSEQETTAVIFLPAQKGDKNNETDQNNHCR